MADINAEGLNQVNDSVQNISDSLNNNSTTISDALRDGLNEIKSEILKVAVESLPIDFLNLAKKVDELTTYTKQLSTLAEESKRLTEKEADDREEDKKSGAASGWTPDKLSSKLSEKDSAPALTIINSLEELFGIKGTFILSLQDMLTTLIKPVGEKSSKKEDEKGNSGGIKVPDLNILKQYNASVKELDKLFGGILKVFFKNKKPRFSEEEIKTIQDTSKAFIEVGKAFNFISTATKSIITVGLLMIPALILLPIVTLFTTNVSLFIDNFSIDKEKTKEVAIVATGLNTVFYNLTVAAGFAIMAGILAIPAAIMVIPIVLFMLSVSLLVVVSKLIKEPDIVSLQIKATNLQLLLGSLFVGAALAIIVGIIAVPAALGVLLLSIFMLTIIVLGIVANIALGFMPQLLLVSVMITVSAILLLIAVTAVSLITIDKLMAVIIGVLVITVLIGLFAILGAISLFALPFLAIFMATAIVIAITMVFFLITLHLIAKVITFMNENLKGDGTGIGSPVDALLMLMGAMIPVALLMVAFAIMGLLALFVLPLLINFMMASIMIAITMFAFDFALKTLVGILKYIDANLSDNKKPDKTGSMLDTILGLVFVLLPMAILMVGFFFLGLLAIICILPMLGLLLFSVIAMNALPLFQQSLHLLFQTLQVAADLIKGEAPTGGIIGAIIGFVDEHVAPGLGSMIGGMVVVLGKMLSLIIIMIALVILGLIAAAAGLGMKGLEYFAESMARTLPQFIAALPLIADLLDAVEKVNRKILGLPDEKEERTGFFDNIKGFFKDAAQSVIGGIQALGKWASLAVLMLTLGAVGVTALVAVPGIEALGRAGEALGRGIPGFVTGFRDLPELLNIVGNRNLRNLDENSFAPLINIMNMLSRVGQNMRNDSGIAAIAESTNLFRLSLEENILTPVSRLDPAVEKLNRLKTATAELNAELKKLTTENRGAIETLADIGTNSGSAAMRVTPRTSSSSTPVTSEGFPMESDPNTEHLVQIKDDVRGIAEKVINNNTSWAAKPAT
jgi:hypothetical protein